MSRGGRHAAGDVAAAAEETRRRTLRWCRCRLFHVYACVGVQSHSIISRTPMALVPNPRDIDDLLKTITTVRPTLFSAVPALFIALLNHPKVKNKSVDFSSIRACFSGAAPLMAATKTQFEELTGGRIVEGYSLTEAMMACIVNPLNGINKVGLRRRAAARRRGRDRRCGVGHPVPAERRNRRNHPARAAADGRLFQQRRGDGSRAARSSPSGSLAVGGDRPVASHRRSRLLDEDSFLFIVDRQKDLIKTSGYQVWPREVEEVLAAHPSRPGSRRRRRARRCQRRGREGVGRQTRRHQPDSRRAARVLPAEPRALQEPGRTSSSETPCRKPWLERCCAARWWRSIRTRAKLKSS